MHPMIGRVIAGRYRLDEPIGRGAMGVVWRARDELLDREVAVKEVVISEAVDESERTNAYQRTLREARTAARLSHRGLVTVYDVAEEDGRPWIIMELVQARSLDQILASSGPLSPRRAAQMAQQLLAALGAAHTAGVMHRDVKPSNVLLGSDGRAVLTDFGIATFQGDPRITQTGMVMGSPGYTAPERIRGGPATPASDLWSLGATLFTAVEGHGPFEKRGGAITTMSAIIHEDAPAAPSAGPLGGVIAALLRRDPGARPDALAASRQIAGLLPGLDGEQHPDTVVSYGQAGVSATVAAGAAAQVGGRAVASLEAGAAVGLGSAHPSGSRSGGGTVGLPADPPTKPQREAPFFTPAPPHGEPSRRPREAASPRESARPMPAPTGVPPSPRNGRGRGRRIMLSLAVVVIAVTAGVAAALLVHSHHPRQAATDQYIPPHPNGALAALNQPSSVTPAGYTTTTVPPSLSKTSGGFAIGSPSDWSRVHYHNLVWRLYAPNGDGYLHVELTQHTYSDMVQEAQFIRNTGLTRNRLPGYTEISLRRATIRGDNGAIWEFTWVNSEGIRMHYEDLLFIHAGQSYALLLVAREDSWANTLPVFEQELSTFSVVTTG